MKWIVRLIQTLLGRDPGMVADKWQAYAEKIEQRFDAQDAKLAACEERHIADQRRIAELENTVSRLEWKVGQLEGK